MTHSLPPAPQLRDLEARLLAVRGENAELAEEKAALQVGKWGWPVEVVQVVEGRTATAGAWGVWAQEPPG